MGEKLIQANPLEQFVLLAKNAKGAAAVELIKQALEANGVYVFAELLDMQNIQDLANTPHAPYLNLLKVFAYGTYKSLGNVEATGPLPELTPPMLRKLRLLTIVTLSERCKLLPYASLQTELSLTNIREVEDLIIEGIAAGIVMGKLDQKNSHFEVEYIMGRDLKSDDYEDIINVLSSWCTNCDTMLTSIQQQVTKLNRDKVEHNDHQMALEQKMNELKHTIKSQTNGDGNDPDSRMDTDRSTDRSSKKGTKGKSTRAGGGKGVFWPK